MAGGRIHTTTLPRVSVSPPLSSESGAPVDRLEAFQERLDAMPDDVLDKATIELRSTINALHTQFALQVREMERRDIRS